MTTAILIPSLDRPQRLAEAAKVIHEHTSEPHRIYFCVADPQSKAVLNTIGEWYLDDSDDIDHRYVTRMNKLVRQLDDEDSIFFGSDDVFHWHGWLTEALKVLESFACVVVNDAHNPNGTQALMRTEFLERAVFDAPGDAFHSGYQHNFADNEQHYTAAKHGEYARAMDSVVEHLHPVFAASNSIGWDSTYTNAMAGWDVDERLFHERMALIDQAIGEAA